MIKKTLFASLAFILTSNALASTVEFRSIDGRFEKIAPVGSVLIQKIVEPKEDGTFEVIVTSARAEIVCHLVKMTLPEAIYVKERLLSPGENWLQCLQGPQGYLLFVGRGATLFTPSYSLGGLATR